MSNEDVEQHHNEGAHDGRVALATLARRLGLAEDDLFHQHDVAPVWSASGRVARDEDGNPPRGAGAPTGVGRGTNRESNPRGRLSCTEDH